MRRTVADLKESTIPETLNVAPEDPRLILWCNMATERLMNRGDWIGAYAKIVVCATGPCIAWRRQVGRVIKAAICKQSTPMFTQWDEFLDFGPGLDLVNIAHPVSIIDDGYSPVVNDIQGDAKKIKVYASVSEDAAAELNVQGFDENAQWIRTQEDDEWKNGQDIPIRLSTATSTKLFGSSPTSIRKPRTNGTVRIFSLHPTDLTEILLAEMAYDEITSNYRRSRIVNFGCLAKTCCACDGRLSITAIVKLAYAPVHSDEDWLLIPNLPAMSMAMQAEQKFASNNHLLSEGHGFLNSAVNELNKEIRSTVGRDTVTIGFNSYGSAKPVCSGIGQMF